MKIKDTQSEYSNCHFEQLQMSEKQLEEFVFEDCKFTKCNFSETEFINCKFVDCEFFFCNLSTIKISRSTFINVAFEDSKVIGVNWSFAYWPQISLPSPIHFLRCDISLSSFFELSLAEMTLEGCKAHEVDFRESDFTSANFAYTDFLGSQFVRTKLIGADFTESINYQIDTELNNIKNAKFSFPEVVSLLNSLEIEIIGLETHCVD